MTSLNNVIRECDKCGFRADQESCHFSHLGDGVWACNECQSKYTHIYEVIDPDKLRKL